MKRVVKTHFPISSNDNSFNASIQHDNGVNGHSLQLGTNVGVGRISCSNGDERRQPQPSSLSNSFVQEDDIAPVLDDPNKPKAKPIQMNILREQIGKVVKATAFSKAISEKAK